MSKWIEFQQRIPDSSKRITKIWEVQTKGQWPNTLGFVKWFPKWRKYSFFPNWDTVFEEECLRDIAQFCEEETKRHKELTAKYRRKK